MSPVMAVGVDAGGTSTVAAMSRGGEYVGEARAGAGNASTLGSEASAAMIFSVVSQLTGKPDALFIAAAGAGRSDVRETLQASLAQRFTGVCIAVEDDARVALRGGHPTGPAIVVIAGTGSVAYAEHGERRVRVGGAGYLLGDEGSGFWIGLAAVRLLARVYDGRAGADEATARVARELRAPDRGALLTLVYARPLDVARIASLAPNVIELAGAGNRNASKIVQSAAAELGDLTRSAARAAGLSDDSPTVVFAGGLLRENTLLSYLLESRITGEIAGCSIVRLREEPSRTALRFAESLLTENGDA